MSASLRGMPGAYGLAPNEAHAARPEGALDARAPAVDLANAWAAQRRDLKLLSRPRRRSQTVIVVGSGLAGAAAAATLSELGHRVVCLCFQDSPRRAHSVAAQGGINACKNYQNDGDSVDRLFLDTLAGGDFRAREANVYRLAELSMAIIDQCVAQGVPFAREYSGHLSNRSFGGTVVSRTFYARGVTGQQLLLGAYQALSKEVAAGGVQLLPRHELLDLVVHDGHARGVIARNLSTGELVPLLGEAVVLASGGYANVFHQSTNAIGSNATAIMRAYQRGAAFANPSFVQFHPTALPPAGQPRGKLILMSEALRNDGRIWVPKSAREPRCPEQIPAAERDYYLERLYPRYGNLCPRDLASRAAKARCDAGHGVGPTGRGVYLDLTDAVRREGRARLTERYGNVLDMYQRATGDDPLQTPMRIYPCAHYSMGGLWVDYQLMSTLPGLFVIGEANFSDHGANRLGASALLQGLADGYFIVPLTASAYLAGHRLPALPESSGDVTASLERAERSLSRLLGVRGRRGALWFQASLGAVLWNGCGLSRDAAGLADALSSVRSLREAFWHELRVPGGARECNQELELAGRVADYLDLGELMLLDALAREESAGCHFRQEHQTPEGEGQRDDERFSHVAAWFTGAPGAPPRRASEPLVFRHTTPHSRNYQ
jgi:succinate dehydrogenase / fumarate reductase, flavoprotein subunit